MGIDSIGSGGAGVCACAEPLAIRQHKRAAEPILARAAEWIMMREA
jgi:hypothetical protein